MTVADIRHPWVRAFINEPDLPRVRLVYRVTILVDNSEEILKPGMPVEADVEAGSIAGP